MSNHLSQQLRRRLLALIHSTEGTTLPPLSKLAKTWSVGAPSLMAAARQLRNEGILEFQQGSRVRITGRDGTIPPSFKAKPQTDSKLLDWLKTGQLKAGRELPKLSLLAKELSVSKSTLCAWLEKLRKEGKAHRLGRKWIFGPTPPLSPQPTSHLQPTIFLVHDRSATWRSIITSKLFRSFALGLLNESDRYGIRLQSVYLHKDRALYSGGIAGKPQILKEVKTLGSLYLGSIILFERNRVSDFNTWKNFFCHLPGRVVWFDRLDEAGGLGHRPDNFFRCHYSESAAIKSALDFLARLGHRKFAYLNPYISHSWAKNRESMLSNMAPVFNLEAVEVHPVRLFQPEHVQQDLRTAIAKLRTHGVRALFAPNDFVALRFSTQLHAGGVRIPQDMGLIGFDNELRSAARGLSTVDFGFDSLGYAAFHLVFGVIPVTHRPNGDVGPKCRVIQRGSVKDNRHESLHKA